MSQTLTSSNGGISLRSSDSIQVSDLNSYAGIYLDAESGSIVSLGLLNAADGVTLVATQNISISDVTAGGLLSIDAEAGDLTFTTGAYLQANLLNADAVNIFGDGFDVASVTDFYLTATGGDITLTDGDIVAGCTCAGGFSLLVPLMDATAVYLSCPWSACAASQRTGKRVVVRVWLTYGA